MQLFIEGQSDEWVEIDQMPEPEIRETQAPSGKQIYLRWYDDDLFVVAQRILKILHKLHPSRTG